MSLTVKLISSRDSWEEFRQHHCPQALFQSWLWGEVQGRLGQKYWRFGLYDGARLAGIFAVYKVSAKRGTFLHVRHGPILLSLKKTYWRYCLDFLRDLGRRSGAWWVRLSPLIEDTVTSRDFFTQFNLVSAAIHSMDAENCWVLDLDKSEEELLREMRKTTRYEIRQAQKLNITLLKTKEPQKLSDFLKLYQETSRRHSFVPHTAIVEEFETLVKEDKALLILASYAGKYLAGAIIIFDDQQAIYHHAASTASSIPASYLVQWEAIGEAKKRGMKIYNFWGIAPEGNLNHPWRGITLFKKGFGGRQLDYLHAFDLPISSWYSLSRAVELWRKWHKGY